MTRVPFSRVRWLVDRMHVGTPCDDVASEIRRRIADNGAAQWTPAEIDAAVRHAVRCHLVNRGRYARVTRGTAY